MKRSLHCNFITTYTGPPGINFGISESSANNIFHYWIDILRELLPVSLLEQVKKKENELEWVKEILTELELIVDSTEQGRERPSEYKNQEKYQI
ncbi:hypothetical protein Tery_1376 [Trichodesmium erythraeum IMS101]|uniref:Transposase Helix-turn-helix domain-containing protein n=1 Tax=Trichodesmium erythraeum (strain IMS101) TaxID=203124 RepID=Q115Y9_TRIEI